MTQGWRRLPVHLKFGLGDKTVFAWELALQVRGVELGEELPPGEEFPSPDSLESNCSGFLIRSQPVSGHQPAIAWIPGYIRYVEAEYERYYVDLCQSFDEYKRKFSSKTRSTINRKLRKFAEHCGGGTRWMVYRSPGEMMEFHRLARVISQNTYQERLLDAGIPASDDFQAQMQTLANANSVRGYILFDGARPISYLYCPASNAVLLYQYLGYDPQYANWSVGTVLHWYVLQDLFREGAFRILDFTEGQSEQKRLFATHSIRCANVYLLRRNSTNACLVYAHRAANLFSKQCGNALERFGIKSKVKHLIRFGRRTAAEESPR